jgi:hypothetical protein
VSWGGNLAGQFIPLGLEFAVGESQRLVLLGQFRDLCLRFGEERGAGLRIRVQFCDGGLRPGSVGGELRDGGLRLGVEFLDCLHA